VGDAELTANLPVIVIMELDLEGLTRPKPERRLCCVKATRPPIQAREVVVAPLSR
jgi:hypothetical protein